MTRFYGGITIIYTKYVMTFMSDIAMGVIMSVSVTLGQLRAAENQG